MKVMRYDESLVHGNTEKNVLENNPRDAIEDQSIQMIEGRLHSVVSCVDRLKSSAQNSLVPSAPHNIPQNPSNIDIFCKRTRSEAIRVEQFNTSPCHSKRSRQRIDSVRYCFDFPSCMHEASIRRNDRLRLSHPIIISLSTASRDRRKSIATPGNVWDINCMHLHIRKNRNHNEIETCV